MPVFTGQNASSATQVANNIPSGLLSFSVVMISSGSLDIYIGSASNYTRIYSATSLNTKDNVQNDTPIKVDANKNIIVVSSGTFDYYFSIE